MVNSSGLISILLIVSCLYLVESVGQTGYNEGYAKLMFYMTAGAYDLPEGCINETSRISGQPFQLYAQSIGDCDSNGNSCAFYTAVSPLAKHIVIVFRGTKGKKQLFHETLQSLQPNVDFYGHGKVNRYFFKALNSLWQGSSAVLMDPKYSDYTVTFTGHSLGGALASLAAMRSVLERLRQPAQIKLYTFGQPRIGNHKFAVEHDKLVLESYRVVNRNDVVPHLPFCHFSDPSDPIDDDSVVDRNNPPRPIEPVNAPVNSPVNAPVNLREHEKDGDLDLTDALKRPCDGQESRKVYHHGTEIWYPNGMVGQDANYIECLGLPKNEDHSCSNGVHLGSGWSTWQRYIDDHLHYFGHKVSKFGKSGCRADVVEVIPQPTEIASFGSAPINGQPQEHSNFKVAVLGALEKLNALRNGGR